MEDPTNLSGLKIRANTPEMAQAIDALGGSAQFMPITDVYPAAQRNVINGAAASATGNLNTEASGVTTPLGT